MPTSLIQNLLPKKEYCCHYRNLRCYLHHWIQLVRVYLVFEFKQSDLVIP